MRANPGARCWYHKGFATARCMRGTREQQLRESAGLQTTEDMDGVGRRRVTTFFSPMLSVLSANDKAASPLLESLTTSFPIAVTTSCFGIQPIGNHFVTTPPNGTATV